MDYNYTYSMTDDEEEGARYVEFLNGVRTVYPPEADDFVNEALEQNIAQTRRAIARRKNRIKKNRRLRHIIIETSGCNPWPGAVDYELDEDGVWRPVGLYIKEMGRNKYRRYVKKRASKAARRDKHFFTKGNGYKKTYDVWWELF